KLDGQTFELKYGYDSLGNQSTLTYPSGRQISYAPNALGQPTKAGDFATGPSYHANGTLTDFTYGNGLKYNLTLNNRQLPEHLKTLKGSTSLTHLQYTYDGNGNTSSITDHKDTTYNIAMGYDGLDRLTAANGKWGAASFTYDTMGNITSKSMGSMAVSYVYDPTTKRLNSASVSGSKSKSYSFTYDKKGAVTNTGNVDLPRNQAGQVTGTGGHSYVYDGNGKRVKDTKNNAPTKARYSIYDKSGRMVYQWDQQTETITDYIFLGGELVTEAQVSLGDGSQSVDNTNVGYTGHQWDNDIGLNYMQARYYDPLLGRFLSNDPVGYTSKNPVMSFNRYLYVNNNPYKFTDPTGKALKIKGSRKFKRKVKKLIKKLKSKAAGRKLLADINRDGAPDVTIVESNGRNITTTGPGTTLAAINGTGTEAIIKFDPAKTHNESGADDNGQTKRPAFVGLAHELGHANSIINGIYQISNKKASNYRQPGTTPEGEVDGIKAENAVRSEHGLTLRSYYFPKESTSNGQ
ncbi:MAG: hypothetical protein HRT35_38950, partial [Algicola sp.]|nr:hypothetical protein [Algicola sp.]